MAKLYNVIVNAKGTEAKEVKVLQGASEKGDPVHIAATRDMRLELQDVAKGSNLAPDQVRLKRMGKNLWLYFDGSEVADVVLDDYYNNDSDAKGTPPILSGYAENGEVYEYIPQDPEVSSLSGALKEGNVPVIMSLGGGALGEFELSALPLVAAAGGGISGLLLGGAALAAAAAGGGKGGGAAAPSGQTGHLTHDATNDTGASATDSYTKNTNPKYTGTAEKGATVVVTVNGIEYTTTASSTDGTYSVDLTNGGKVLPDGVYKPSIVVKNSAGSSLPVDGEAFTVDSKKEYNQDGAKTPTDQTDSNSSAAVKINIGTIDDGLSTTASATGSKDTGSSKTDFVTSDGTLTFQGTVTGFVANGDLVHVQVEDSKGQVIFEKYVKTNANGDWTWTLDNQTNTLPTGDYTIKAAVEDLAGNVVQTAKDQPLAIKGPNTLVARSDSADVGEGADVSATAAQGVLANDGDTTATSITVTKVGTTAADRAVIQTDTTTKTTIIGKYGQLDMFSDGHYQYKETDHSLTADQKVVDTFTYEVKAGGTNRTETAQININVTGVNDAATMNSLNRAPTAINDKTTVENALGNNNKPITISDVDTGETVIQGLNSTANATTETQGSLGKLTMTADGLGAYGFSYSKDTNIAVVKEDTKQHDLFSLTSKDGTANETLDFVLTGSGTITKQDFNVNPLGTEDTVSGLTATGSTSTDVTDTLVLHGSTKSSQQTTFDFTDATATEFTSIEKIDMQGAGPNLLKLSLASLTQGDTANSVSQKLYVNGDASDTVDYHSVTSSATVVTHDESARSVDGLNYYVYHIGNDELLVQTTIANISVHS